MPSSARRRWAAPPALARASAPACPLLSAITMSPLRRTATGRSKAMTSWPRTSLGVTSSTQDGTTAAERDVEDAAGHDAVGRVGSADLADRAEVEAAGMAAHRLGDQSHARPRQPHQVPVQGVDRATGVAAAGGSASCHAARSCALSACVARASAASRSAVVTARAAGRVSALSSRDERKQRAERDERHHGDGEGARRRRAGAAGLCECVCHAPIVRLFRPRGSPEPRRSDKRESGAHPPPST